jgi:molybdopterin/thiamine biosynthesis adenylyltransferase
MSSESEQPVDIVSRYDRQVRLWGAESQQKMMNSKILYIHVTGISAEILKNLALAGIKVTLCDTRPMSAELTPHFFFPGTSTTTTNEPTKRIKYATVAHAVQPLVEEMNPLLDGCPILEKTVEDLTEDDLRDFTVIVASQIPLTEAVRLSKLVATLKRKLYVADVFGFNGTVMMDLGSDLMYRPEVGKQLLDPVPLKPYVSLEDLVQVPLHECVNRFHKTPPSVYLQYRCLLEYHAKKGHFPGGDQQEFDETIFPTFLKAQKVSLPEETLRVLGKAGMAQLAPVCAILGGILGNEIIKVISGKAEPANNTILFDGKTCKAWTFLVQPKAS